MNEFSMEQLFYYGTGIITMIVLAIFIVGLIIAYLPETQPRQVAYAMKRKRHRRHYPHS